MGCKHAYAALNGCLVRRLQCQHHDLLIVKTREMRSSPMTVAKLRKNTGEFPQTWKLQLSKPANYWEPNPKSVRTTLLFGNCINSIVLRNVHASRIGERASSSRGPTRWDPHAWYQAASGVACGQACSDGHIYLENRAVPRGRGMPIRSSVSCLTW